MNIYEKEHLNSLRALLPECTVLLRKSGAFPLEKPCSLVLCGNGARCVAMFAREIGAAQTPVKPSATRESSFTLELTYSWKKNGMSGLYCPRGRTVSGAPAKSEVPR